MSRVHLLGCLVLALGCAVDPMPLDCAHGLLEGRARGGARMDLLFLVDGASLPPEARAHIEGAVSRFVASSVGDDLVEELYAGVVIADDRDGELGKLAPPTAECPAPGEAAMTWAAARELPVDEVAGGLGCRAGAMVGREREWDPAAALERVMAERELPRSRLRVVLITARDLEETDALAQLLANRDLTLTVVAGIRALDLDGGGVDASGCEGAIDAAPAPALLAMALELAETRGLDDVQYASVCSSDWGVAGNFGAQGFGRALGCLARAPIVDADGLARCEVLETLPARSVIERCDELPGRELVDAGDLSTCRIRQGDGFVVGPPSPELCPGEVAEVHFDVELAAGAEIEVHCQTVLSDPVDCE